MPEGSRVSGDVASDLLALTARARARTAEDPFGNPVLSIALAITRMSDNGNLDLATITDLVRSLRDQAFADRAERIAQYVGGIEAPEAAFATLAHHLVRPDPDDSPIPWRRFQAEVERTRFAAVFTAHPTFALPSAVNACLARMACGGPAQSFASHRPTKPTLQEEFEQAMAAMHNGRDAIDQLNEALISAASETWRDRWATLTPRAVVLTSWVGYDTDGRTDIGWWDTLRLRLLVKQLQLQRVAAQLAELDGVEAVRARVDTALDAVRAQIEAAPPSPDPDAVTVFARALLGRREDAMVTPAPVIALLDEAIANAPAERKLRLVVIRAGVASHGLALAHTHVRLNSAQLHNAVRLRLGIAEPPGDPARRRTMLAAINAALDEVTPVPLDFGALIAEQASAVKLMMTVAQIVKHIDASVRIRFLIAETETGYTLLSALWLARRLGIAEHIEISPLFETAAALENGAHVLDEALRSPHYREYLKSTGKLCLQFGYSDSGRYVGQLAASYLIERLRLKVGETLAKHDVTGVEIVLFDTHGESIGRGAHPGSLADRLKYLSPTASRQAFNKAGLPVREESAFQGGDGYLLFGTKALATATVARIAEHAFAESAGPIEDPVYADPDFATDFFATIRAGMEELVEDPGYIALLGAFGPALLDPSGSRPDARQQDGGGGPVTLRHPSELRAIRNNAILQQLGWCANTLQGLGAAAARHPETFTEMHAKSRRFRRAVDLATHGLLHSDVDVLRAVIATLDPGSWLDRAGHTRLPGRAAALTTIAASLEQTNLWAPALAMFRRIQVDHLAMRAAWPDTPRMADREVLLHALRLALIHRIWLLGTQIPDFSPRYGVTRQALQARLLRLDVPGVLKLLADIFPAAPDPSTDRDYGEPHGPRGSDAYVHEHADIFAPMGALFELVREIATAITHEVGAFG
jgi:phosphoenolpyruvate carboxylase